MADPFGLSSSRWRISPRKLYTRRCSRRSHQSYNVSGSLPGEIQHRAKSGKACKLVFPTAGCRPKLDFLDCLKAVADSAGLEQENFWLHKFRATFATWSLWAGVDLRTVQQWPGHSDMESSMRYLKPWRSQQVREKVNEIFAGGKEKSASAWKVRRFPMSVALSSRNDKRCRKRAATVKSCNRHWQQ